MHTYSYPSINKRATERETESATCLERGDAFGEIHGALGHEGIVLQ